MSGESNERDLTEKVFNLREQKRILSDQVKETNEALERAEYELMELLRDQSKEATATYQGLGYITICKPRLWASITEENKPSAFRWLESQGLSDVIKQTVNQMTLSSLVRERIEGGLEVPECVTYYLQPQLRLVKQP
jgi:hypothetical protein